MSFETLLGNEQLKQNLSRSLQKGRIPHFYLISGPEGSGKHTLAGLLAAAIFCREENRPCGLCESCRKVRANTHPDFITVDDPEKKTVPVELVRQARADIFVRPNEAEHKIYCFPRADDLGIPGQNALLKVLEEPPEYGVFLLLCRNPDKLLPTVRSRCVELKMQGLPERLLRTELHREFPEAAEESIRAAAARCGGYLGQAKKMLRSDKIPPQTQDFISYFCQKDGVGILSVLAPMEKWKRDDLIPLLQSWMELTTEAMADRAGQPAVAKLAMELAHGCNMKQLHRLSDCLQKCLEYARGNVSVGAVCGYLAWQLQDE